MRTGCSKYSKLQQLLTLCLTVATLGAALLPMPAVAEPFETEASMNSAIQAFLKPKLNALNASRINIDIGRIDPRLRLQKCSQPLDLEQLGNKSLSGKVNIRVSCREASWGIFIPVDIQIFEPVVVSRVTLPRGTIISRELLSLREMESSALNYSYFRDIDQVAGTETTRPIQANGIVFTNMVQAADAIRKGDEVIIKAKVGSLSVRMKGQALQDGAIGEQIQVRNLQSRRIIRAIITGPGNVLVPL